MPVFPGNFRATGSTPPHSMHFGVPNDGNLSAAHLTSSSGVSFQTKLSLLSPKLMSLFWAHPTSWPNAEIGQQKLTDAQQKMLSSSSSFASQNEAAHHQQRQSHHQITVYHHPHQEQQKYTYQPGPSAGNISNSEALEFVVKSSLPPVHRCTGCGLDIEDRHLIKIQPGGCHLHEHCAICCVCRCPLEAKCFERQGRLFCRMHYSLCALRPTPCAGCQQPIDSNELVYKLNVGDIVYHVRCHRCVLCGRQLAPGEQIVVDQRSQAVACAFHFLSDVNNNTIAEEGGTNNSSVHFSHTQPSESDQLLGLAAEVPAQFGTIEQTNGQHIGIARNSSTLLCGDGNNFNGLTAMEEEQRQKEAQIEQELATARRLTDQMIAGREQQQHQMDSFSQPTAGTFLAHQQSPLIDGSDPLGQQQQPQSSSKHFQLNFGPNTISAGAASGQMTTGGDGTEFAQQLLAATVLLAQQSDNHHQQQQIGPQSAHQFGNSPISPSSTRCPMTMGQPQERDLPLDGIVLSTLSNINSAIGTQQEKRNGKKKKPPSRMKTTAEAGQAVRRTSSCTPVPVPQYPFEMYAAGEQYSRQEEEFQQKAQGNKRRGPRTTISQHQLDILNAMFANTPKPSKHARAKLAVDAGLSMRVIQVWFQNRRSKERRLKHLCNFLRHCDSQGPATGEEDTNEAEVYDEEGGEEEEEDEDEEDVPLAPRRLHGDEHQQMVAEEGVDNDDELIAVRREVKLERSEFDPE